MRNGAFIVADYYNEMNCADFAKRQLPYIEQ